MEYMPKGKAGRKGSPSRIYLDKEQETILDAISEAKGRRHLDVRPNRSQLIATAIRNYISECEEAEEDLREAIREARDRSRESESKNTTEPELGS